MLYKLFNVVFVFVPVLFCVAFFTVAERKIMGSVQRRKGPNVVGFFGFFQALADGLKLFLKESILPSSSNKNLFIFAPLLMFFLSLAGWAVLPLGFNNVFCDLPLSVLYLLAVSSFSVYGVIIAGWSSNSKYAFLGALRSSAQMISYEISFGFILLNIVVCSGSLNLTDIVFSQRDVWFFFPLFPMFCLFFISCLAETNRHPFDLPEAEAELVSGYNVEYSAIGFALFFLGEYSNMILVSCLSTIFFCGGWFFPIFSLQSSFFFGFKTSFFMFLFIWSRVAFPRYRYDQLITLGWKVFFPLVLSWVIFTSGVLLGFNWLP